MTDAQWGQTGEPGDAGPTGPAGQPGPTSQPAGYPPPPAYPPPAAYPPPPPPPPTDYTPYAGGGAPPGMYVDPHTGLILPQGVVLASVGRRIGAWFLAIPLFIVTLGIGYAIWGLIVWSQGTTPALSVLGMRCWRPEDGRPPGFWWMALREIVGRIAEGIVGLITSVVSFVLFLTGREHRSLHDLIAGTVVLHDPQKVLAPQ
jgi:uncharacterized RDD family membrane protein YckC